jgi:U4/U6.U5 tri-snRNP-associated protein 2
METYTLIKDRSQIIKMKKKIVKIDGIEYYYEVKKTKFYYLTFDLPSIPLFKDSNKKINIPQVPIKELLKKFSGEIFIDEPIKEQKKKLKIVSLPKYLILIFKRFHNNMIFMEKNPTIIKFPLENLEIGDSSYNILSNIIHDGKPEQGSYKIQIKNKIRKEWYQIKDLNVDTILPESVLIDESYIQFYERNNKKKE